MTALSCVPHASWWPVVLVALFVGVGIGVGIANWFYKTELLESARRIHPSRWGDDRDNGPRGDGGGRGERWEQ